MMAQQDEKQVENAQQFIEGFRCIIQISFLSLSCTGCKDKIDGARLEKIMGGHEICQKTSRRYIESQLRAH